MDFNSDDFRDQLEAILFKIKTGFTQVIRLLGYGLLCGTIVGAVASVFALGIDFATELRAQHPWVNPDVYVPDFYGNFASMKTDKGNSHGKVFTDDGYNIGIWEVVEHTIEQYRSLFLK